MIYSDNDMRYAIETEMCEDRAPIEFRTHSQLPTILHTSVEAREVGLEHYKLEFGFDLVQSLGLMQLHVLVPPQIYVNWDSDTICLMPTNMHPRTLNKLVQRLIPITESRCKVAFDYIYFQKLDQRNMKTQEIFNRALYTEIIIYYVPQKLRNYATLVDPDKKVHLDAPGSVDFVSIEKYVPEGDDLQQKISCRM